MKKIFKKSVAAVVAVTLVTSPVRADFFSDFCGAIFTILTAPIALIAPDNPTLRKNNPFRKKLWQEQAEREAKQKERDDQILQRYLKQSPTVAAVPAPAPVAPQIPMDQIIERVMEEVKKSLPKPQEKSLTVKDVTDIVLAQVPKLLPKKSAPQITIDEVRNIIREEIKSNIPATSAAEINLDQIINTVVAEVNTILFSQLSPIVAEAVKNHKEHVPQNELIEIVRNEVKLQKLQVNFSEDDLEGIIVAELKKQFSTIVGAVAEKVEGDISPLIAQVSATKTEPKETVPKETEEWFWLDYITDVVVKASLCLSLHGIENTVMTKLLRFNNVEKTWQLMMGEEGVKLLGERAVLTIPVISLKNKLNKKIFGAPNPSGWRRYVIDIGLIATSIGTATATWKISNIIIAYWLTRAPAPMLASANGAEEAAHEERPNPALLSSGRRLLDSDYNLEELDESYQADVLRDVPLASLTNSAYEANPTRPQAIVNRGHTRLEFAINILKDRGHKVYRIGEQLYVNLSNETIMVWLRHGFEIMME